MSAPAAVRCWQPSAVEAAAVELGPVGSALDVVTGGVAGLADRLALGAWRGPAARLAASLVAALLATLRCLVVVVAAVRWLLDRTAADLAAASRELAAVAAHVADDPRLDLTPDGWPVVRPRGLGDAWPGPLGLGLWAGPGWSAAEAATTASALAVRTRRAVDDATAAAAACARGLAEGADRLAAAGPAAVPTAGTPSAAARWWGALTGAERAARLGVDPGRLGRLEGLPADVRDRANREVLRRRLASWAGVGPTDPRWPWAQYAHTLDLRVARELARGDRRVDPVTGRAVPCRLLVYEPGAYPGGGARVAVVTGDVDRAANVAVLVPGLMTDAGVGTAALDDSAWNLYAAVRAGSDQAVAVVAWTGYDTPELDTVVTDERAAEGARALARDIAGLLDGHQGAPPHVTVVGHSYGSLVAALGVAQLPGAVDDLAVLGSPGLDADQAADLLVRPGHVWVGAASADPVSHLSRFGTDPSAESFGAFRFPAEPSAPTPPFAQHSRYLDPGSDSLAAVAAVVGGYAGGLTHAPGRTDAGLAGEALHRLLLGPFGGVPDPTFGDPAAGRRAATAQAPR